MTTAMKLRQIRQDLRNISAFASKYIPLTINCQGKTYHINYKVNQDSSISDILDTFFAQYGFASGTVATIID